MSVALEIVSPERLLLARAVKMVVIPAYEGELGVLEGHAPMIVLLRGGEIRLYEGTEVSERVFVSGGFAEITPERCTVLAAEVMTLSEVSRSEAERRLAAAEEAYVAADKTDMEAVDLAMDRIQSARAMLELAHAA